MLELEVVLRNEAEEIRAHILECADPTALFREATDELTCNDLQVTLLVQWVEVAHDFVHLEVLRFLELLQVGLSNLDPVREGPRQGQCILTLALRGQRVVQVGVSENRVSVNAEVLAVQAGRLIGLSGRLSGVSLLIRVRMLGIEVRDHVFHAVL